MSCFDDLSIKRCLEDVMDKKVENESLVWIIWFCDVGWRGY